jgi:diguanylate cyclase (GGDEF)-like protein/PAS domain S-box-containing protein
MNTRFSLRSLLLGNLRRQLMVGMGLVVSVMMTMLVWQWGSRQHADLKNQQTLQAVALAESIALSSGVWVASRDLAGLQEIANSSLRYPDVRYVILLDRQGRVLAHSSPELRGKFMTDLPKSPETTLIQNASTLLDVGSPVMLDKEHLGWVRLGLGRAQLDQQFKQLFNSGLLYLASGAILIVILASITGHYFTRRLSAISRVAESVRAGNTSQRVDLRGTDEAASLAREFNTMLDTLQQREEELLHSQDALRVAATAFESNDVMFVCDTQWRIMQVNRGFERVTGYTAEQAIGQKPRDLLGSNMQDERFYEAMDESIRLHGSWQGEVWDRRSNGETFPAWSTITAVKNKTGQLTHYVANLSDFSARKAAENEIKTLVFFDALTSLPNRRLLMDRLTTAMQTAHSQQRMGALIFVDLDDFKTLNDTLGHHQGDRLLQQVATRLLSCVRGTDTVARLGGDEFVVMLEGLSDTRQEAATQAEATATKLMAALNAPYTLGPLVRNSTPSMGITLFGEHEELIDEPLKRADLAMYQAKAAGRNTCRMFDPQTQAAVTRRSELEAALHTALDRGEFALYLQPQISDRGGQPVVTGAEALIRWKHPTRGVIGPGEFIALAEDCGMILPIGQWLLNSACHHLARWRRLPELATLTLAINVSAKQFHQPDFAQQVMGELRRQGVEPSRLKIEITESMLISNVDDVIARMEELQGHGVGFAMDDFGTGYSSLTYLKRLPLDVLKIDQSFVREVLSDSDDAAIVNMILALADSLGLNVVAEGVETTEQMHYLARQGCHAYQGYLFSKPCPVDEFESGLTRFLAPLQAPRAVSPPEQAAAASAIP